MITAVESFSCGRHHFGPAKCVDVHHPDAELRGRTDRTSDRIWNVVKFQIEKNPVPGIGELAHQIGSGRTEQFETDLERSNRTIQFAYDPSRVVSIADIEGDDDLFSGIKFR